MIHFQSFFGNSHKSPNLFFIQQRQKTVLRGLWPSSAALTILGKNNHQPPLPPTKAQTNKNMMIMQHQDANECIDANESSQKIGHVDLTGVASCLPRHQEEDDTSIDSELQSLGGGSSASSANLPVDGPGGPASNDIICARGSVASRHPGNLRYKAIVRQHRGPYQNVKHRFGKGEVTNAVIARVREHGGRFVKFDKKTKSWVELGRDAVYDKVSHALRSSKDCKGPLIVKEKKSKEVSGSQTMNSVYSRQMEIFQRLLQEDMESANNNYEIPPQNPPEITYSLPQPDYSRHPSYEVPSSTLTLQHQYQQQTQHEDAFQPLPLESSTSVNQEESFMTDLANWAQRDNSSSQS